MDILIIAQYLRNIENFDTNNSRFVYLSKMLRNKEKNKIEIITSNFCHSSKKHYKSVGVLNNVTITTLHEPGYPKNVCLKRFYSHSVLAKNITRYLNNRKEPDLIYCAIPSLDVGYNVAKFCKKNDVKFVIDVQDLWPEAFKVAINIPVVSSVIFKPFDYFANYVYKNCDCAIALSNTNLQRVIKANTKVNSLCVYLGSQIKYVDKQVDYDYVDERKDKKEIWIGYLGTLGNSYDIENPIYAVKEVQKKYKNVRLVLIGDGPLMDKFKSIANNNNVNVLFTGRKNYIEALNILNSCDIALNPFKKGAEQSVTNKVVDYAILGIPIVNTLENDEYRDMVDENDIGINVECENYKSIADGIIYLIENESSRIKMGKNNRKLAEKIFDRDITYKRIVDIIEKIGKNNQL